ncbi:MAG: LysM peptidoglycan-binding domain-containing protein, partial [Nitrospirota bacterium]|nr:LysM peptidoglycan-binding domain-containing protein [Nitrospirota bacterium]
KIPLTGNSGRNLRVSGALESEVSQESEYQVRKGDSLSLIARKFNTDTKSLQKINKLTSANISVGQVLRVTR